MLAVVGLAHGPIAVSSGLVVFPLMHATAWTPEIATIDCLLHLCFAAFVGWLAFAVFETNADVTIIPRRWRDLGAPLAVWCVAQELYTAVSVWRFPAEYLPAAHWWMAAFTDLGQLRVGWLAVALLAAAAAEEIVYRALLLPALEGYMGPTRALVVHAAVFELVHAFVYGYGLSGVWFLGGMVLGYAFLRTRSLAVPTLLHAAHNIVFFTLVWHFNH